MPEGLFAGRYRLGELLGRGGMSEVWSATDTELGRRVALKFLAPHADTARFEREARAFASLSHPNVVQLYDYGAADGRPFMVLEYLPGGTLEDRLRSGKPVPDAEATRIATEIAGGLAHAHGRGVVHRDLKPANVLFDEDGRAKLADFGIARVAAGDGTLTEAGTVLGTAAYISPEQAAGAPATAASDVYSFGVLLYRMLAGRLPFVSSDPMELVALHRDAEPPSLRTFRPDAPPLLAATATAALAKDPAARPRDGRALLAALGAGAGADFATAPTMLTSAEDAATRVLPADPMAGAAAAPTRRIPTTPPGGAPPPGRPPRSRLPLVAAGLIVLALAGVALAYGLTRPSHESTPTTTAHSQTHPTTQASTQASTSTAAATTAPTTTPTTTQAATTTRPTTTAPTTTSAPPPTTTEPPPPTTTATTPTVSVPTISVTLPTP